MTVNDIQKRRCRHERHSWLLSGGGGRTLEWCYVCGALRPLHEVPGTHILEPSGKWLRPTGDPDNNPFDKWSTA